MKIGELKKLIANLPANAEITIKNADITFEVQSAKVKVNEANGAYLKYLVLNVGKEKI